MKKEIRIIKDVDSLRDAAAGLFIEQAHAAVQARGRFLAALTGGGTPLPLYHRLASTDREALDWSRTHFFWVDERCVPPGDPGSNFGQTREALLNHVAIPADQLHRIRGELGPEEASKDYARVLKLFEEPPLDWPRFDLVLLGLGEDGHTASLFPGSPVEDRQPTLAVTAHYQDRPAERVTLTPAVFNSAHKVVFMVSGPAKAGAVERVLGGGRDPLQLPAQRIEPKTGELIWLIDESAAAQLPRRGARDRINRQS